MKNSNISENTTEACDTADDFHNESRFFVETEQVVPEAHGGSANVDERFDLSDVSAGLSAGVWDMRSNVSSIVMNCSNSSDN